MSYLSEEAKEPLQKHELVIKNDHRTEEVHGLRDQNDLLQLLEAVYSKRNETSIYLSGKNTTEKKRVAEI